jgi:hypothetical protein
MMLINRTLKPTVPRTMSQDVPPTLHHVQSVKERDALQLNVQGMSLLPPSTPSSHTVKRVVLTTRDVKTCKACMGNFQTCRKSEVSAGASEGIERARPAAQ